MPAKTGPVPLAKAPAGDKQERIAQYARAYRADYGFESEVVAARQRVILELLAASRPSIIVEVGCGPDLLVLKAIAAGLQFGQWIIVEPSHVFADVARRAAKGSTRVEIVEAFFEDALPEIHNRCAEAPELVLCASVLQEVPNPTALLAAARALLSPGGGVLHVSVPNAFSLHRRLARAMGIVTDEHQLSRRNHELGQPRVFDATSLGAQLRAAGFVVQEVGGYLLKPFTHQQMSELKFLTQQMIGGLRILGRELPELSCEIYANARLKP